MAMVSGFMSFTPRRGAAPSSEPELPGLDAVVERLVDSDERALLAVVHVDGVLGDRGIEALTDERVLRVLQRGRHGQLAPQPEEQRPRVRRQSRAEVRAK